MPNELHSADHDVGDGRQVPVTLPTRRVVKAPTERLSAAIAEELRQLIMDGTLRPGDRLPTEPDLCEHYGVSRITIREAVQMLRTLDLIESTRGRGTFVRSPQPSEVLRELAYFAFDTESSLLDLFDVRSLLEGYALQQATMRFAGGEGPTEQAAPGLDALDAILEEAEALLADSPSAPPARLASLDAQFHIEIATITGNLVLTNLLERLMGIFTQVRPRSLAVPGQAERSWLQHREMALALRAGQVDDAIAHLNAHMDSVLAALKSGTR